MLYNIVVNYLVQVPL